MQVVSFIWKFMLVEQEEEVGSQLSPPDADLKKKIFFFRTT